MDSNLQQRPSATVPSEDELLAPARVSQLRGVGRSVEVLAPGAVSVTELHDGIVILDPHINFVRVTRPEWLQDLGKNIEKKLVRAVRKSQVDRFHFEDSWDSGESDFNAPSWRRDAFNRRLGVDRAVQLVAEDQMRIRSFLVDATGATSPHTTFRLELSHCSAGRHVDAQAITAGVCYFGGGTEVELLNGKTLALQVGEIGLWKGAPSIADDFDGLGAASFNRGQGVLHGAPESVKSYPRFIGLTDVRDSTLSQAVARSLMHWSD